jgi:hypothetical protein
MKSITVTKPKAGVLPYYITFIPLKDVLDLRFS